MTAMLRPWDYLILTATNDLQAAGYKTQVELRRSIGQLTQVRHVLVIADLGGRRIGSGGSTIECLRQVVANEQQTYPEDSSEAILARLRILILHAGGDSRRLPAYSPCGKIFVPLPGESYSALGSTLFDRLVPSFLALPGGGVGQVVVAAGDALIDIDPSELHFDRPGITALGSYASPDEARRHGVFCPGSKGSVRLFMQKPTLDQLKAAAALNRDGQAVLDLGIMSLNANAAARLLNVFCDADRRGAHQEWKPAIKAAMLECGGIDLYREICCALGTEATLAHYRHVVRSAGGRLDDELLSSLFVALRTIPLSLQMVGQSSFLHFGTTRQLITSGIALITRDQGKMPASTALAMNNALATESVIEGHESWIEGCSISAPLRLERKSVLTGIDVISPLTLPEGACIDVSEGLSHQGTPVRFVRCYGVNDTFKHAAQDGATFCGILLTRWMRIVGASNIDLWPDSVAELDRTLWNARIFPAEQIDVEQDPEPYRRWLWFFDVQNATTSQKQTFLAADRYSAQEIATLVDQAAFHARRAAARADEIEHSVHKMFRTESPFSAHDLAFALQRSPRRGHMVATILNLAHDRLAPEPLLLEPSRADFSFARITHSLGSALGVLAANDTTSLESLAPGLAAELSPALQSWMNSRCLSMPPGRSARSWATRLCDVAFENINESIVNSSMGSGERPHNALRPDETIWGRSPARIELAGGWTDTPPYTLEHGGDVTNTAINLNGQPPIHCYCRITQEPLIRLNSIDGGRRLEIRELAELVDYRRPGDPFALAKAALAISGFAPDMADWPQSVTLRQMLEDFGGGIELTTLVGIPQGSGLGTSSILGATILGVIARMVGRKLNRNELFYNVLRLEQALTTGGGWQDQVGGCIGGSKITSTRPGMFPDASIHYVPSDVLDPKLNGGCSLLYYTGLTRIAKNILREIVGGYLDRDRAILEALAEEHVAARAIADTMSRKDISAFGQCVDSAWALQKRLCRTVTNPVIEELLGRVRPYVHGMRISGAGSGGFLLMIAKSPADAAHIRTMLEENPLNERSRFFDFEVNNVGLEVTTC